MEIAPNALKNAVLVLENRPKILLAVSGGGDSVALLHLCAAHLEKSRLSVATVDHGLRPESASEAKFVARLCEQLDLPHTTLIWDPPENASSQDARLARYHLLTRRALETGATAIALAHTLDDQAETLVMRVRRMTSESGTRGLAGISQQSAYAPTPDQSIKLLRPLLGATGVQLQDYLRHIGCKWIDDPSNDNPDYERVRVRNLLSACSEMPPANEIARLATLSSGSRGWLNQQTAELLCQHMSVHSDGNLFLQTNPAPFPLIENAFATLVLVAGGLEHYTSVAKIKPLAGAFVNGAALRRNVGRALVTIGSKGARFEREARHQADPELQHGPVDGRFFYHDTGKRAYFIKALEQFRPLCDDSVHAIINEKLKRATPDVENNLSDTPA